MKIILSEKEAKSIASTLELTGYSAALTGICFEQIENKNSTIVKLRPKDFKLDLKEINDSRFITIEVKEKEKETIVDIDNDILLSLVDIYGSVALKLFESARHFAAGVSKIYRTKVVPLEDKGFTL